MSYTYVKNRLYGGANNFIMMDVCNPSTASDILDKNIEMGYVLPCKVVVYEKEGDTYIGLMNPSVMVDLVDSQYYDVAVEIEKSMKEVMI